MGGGHQHYRITLVPAAVLGRRACGRSEFVDAEDLQEHAALKHVQ
jgi:hypothetical protein